MPPENLIEVVSFLDAVSRVLLTGLISSCSVLRATRSAPIARIHSRIHYRTDVFKTYEWFSANGTSVSGDLIYTLRFLRIGRSLI